MAIDEQPPASSPDPWSSTALKTVISRFFFVFNPFDIDKLPDFIVSELEQRATEIQRPLTIHETRALAYHLLKENAATGWGIPIGFAIGEWRSSYTKENYRFPFVGGLKREGGWFDGERIQIMGREVARGEPARLIIRACCNFGYGAAGLLFCTGCGYFIGGFAGIWGTMRDPRLKDYYVDLRAKFRNDAVEKWKQGITQWDPKGQGRPRINEVWREYRDAVNRRKARGAEAKTVAGRHEMKHASDEGMIEGGDVGGAESGAQIKWQETSQQTVATSSFWSNLYEAERQPIGSTEPEPKPDPSTSTESDWSQEASDGGSAWERIRIGAGSQGGAAAWGKKQRRRTTTGGHGAGGWQKQREQREGSGGDDFTFSSSEQERSYARDEAQQDFDARVERERQGGEFSEGSRSGKGRRWG